MLFLTLNCAFGTRRTVGEKIPLTLPTTSCKTGMAMVLMRTELLLKYQIVVLTPRDTDVENCELVDSNNGSITAAVKEGSLLRRLMGSSSPQRQPIPMGRPCSTTQSLAPA